MSKKNKIDRNKSVGTVERNVYNILCFSTTIMSVGSVIYGETVRPRAAPDGSTLYAQVVVAILLYSIIICGLTLIRGGKGVRMMALSSLFVAIVCFGYANFLATFTLAW